MSAEPARALPSSGFLRIFATFYRALLVARRLFVVPVSSKLYEELSVPTVTTDSPVRAFIVLVLSEPSPSGRLPRETRRRRRRRRPRAPETTGKDSYTRKRDRDKARTLARYYHTVQKQVTHTYTQEEKRARERGAKGHPPGATPESVLSFSHTLLRLPSLLCRRLYLSRRTSPPHSANGARTRVRGREGRGRDSSFSVVLRREAPDTRRFGASEKKWVSSDPRPRLAPSSLSIVPVNRRCRLARRRVAVSLSFLFSRTLSAVLSRPVSMSVVSIQNPLRFFFFEHRE